MMKLRSVLFFGFLALSPQFLFSGTTGKIAGNIKDSKTHETLVGVNILIEGTRLGGTTDPSGDYFVINIPPGTYNITASLVGYRKVTITDVRVQIDRTSTLNFSLTDEAMEMEGVTVIAEKPKVEVDLTSSKETMSREEISKGWSANIKDVVADIPSANINGGIRGSFGLDVAYKLDGLDLRDVGSNTNFASVNLSTIQEVEVLTGGWNAEFGQANGSIINIVTRHATDRIHGISTSRMRPAGVYHWGRNFYGSDDPFRTVMTTPNFWNPDSFWRTPWMADSLRGYDGGSEYFRSLGDTGRANWWKNFVNDKNRFPQIGYADRAQWEQEITLYGPITSDVGFMLSGRYMEGVGIYPSALKYNPELTLQGSLDMAIQEETKLNLTGLFTKFENSGAPRTNYQSSEMVSSDIVGQQLPYISDPYSDYRYWLVGSKGSSDPAFIRPPERAQMLNMQAKLTHVFDKNTFAEFALQHSQMKYFLDYRDIAWSAWFPGFGLPLPTDSLNGVPNLGQPPTSFFTPRWGYGGDVWRSWSDNRGYSVKGDITSQVTKEHLVKAGFLFSLQRIEKHTHEGGLASGLVFAQVDDIIPIIHHPYEGALYAQDKIEVGGMVVNAGLRFDFFNPNQSVSSDIFDPLMLLPWVDENGDTTKRTGVVGYRPDGSGARYTKTPTRYAISPRIGISHPITETTVLHFMFGVFNQRPAWNKILANPVVWTNQLPSTMNSDFYLPESTIVTYRYFGQKVGNPALTWEKMTQYEVGFEQNILDKISLDVTMYYKDAHDLTSLGLDQGPASVQIQESGANVDMRMYGDPLLPDGQIPGVNIRNFTTSVNGAWADVRGLEVKLDTRLPWVNFDFSYNLSYLSTGSYHLTKKYKTFYDADGNPYQLGIDNYLGASNTDGGGIGLDDAGWNPHNSALLKINITSPDNFGPNWGSIYPLGDWSISTSTRWVEGEVYTYYPPSYTGIQVPNNRKWDNRWSTNLNLNKTFRLYDGVKLKFFTQVTNLFNQKQLKLLSGTNRTDYMENGVLPIQSTTKEPMEWSWYSNLPRQINIGTTLEF
jgi:hypothetical protein